MEEKLKMLDRLSIEAQRGIEKFCEEKELGELFSAARYDGQPCAWLYFLLRATPDTAEWFPRGKWATLQRLEPILDSAAQVDIARLPALRSGQLESGDHVLEVVSYHDGIAECSCGKWRITRTGSITRTEAEREHHFHVYGKFPVDPYREVGMGEKS